MIAGIVIVADDALAIEDRLRVVVPSKKRAKVTSEPEATLDDDDDDLAIATHEKPG